jgi:hypothetical protein
MRFVEGQGQINSMVGVFIFSQISVGFECGVAVAGFGIFVADYRSPQKITTFILNAHVRQIFAIFKGCSDFIFFLKIFLKKFGNLGAAIPSNDLLIWCGLKSIFFFSTICKNIVFK